MEQTPRREERPIRSGRLKAALKSTAQMCVAAVACALWIGLALPGLQLLPGVGDLANTSVAISLQSALLGIDDTSTFELGVGACRPARARTEADPAIAVSTTCCACAEPLRVDRSSHNSTRARWAHPMQARLRKHRRIRTSSRPPIRRHRSSRSRCRRSALLRPPHPPKPVVPSAPSAPPASTPPPSAPPSLSLQTIVFTSTPPDERRCRCRDVCRVGSGQLRSARHLLGRSFELEDLHGLGHDRRADRCGHLHDRCRPARRQQLPRRGAGSAVVRDRYRHEVAQRADDQLRLRPARRGSRRRVRPNRGDGELRACRSISGRRPTARASAMWSARPSTSTGSAPARFGRVSPATPTIRRPRSCSRRSRSV